MTDHDIDKLYKHQATEQPPIAVDNKITQLAQESVKDTFTKKPLRLTQKYMPFTLAASIGLVGLLVLNFPQYYTQAPMSAPDEALIDQSIPVQLNDHEQAAPLLTPAPLQLKSTNKAIVNNETRTSLERKKMAELQRSKREIQPQIKLIKHTLLKKIAQQTTLNNTTKAAQLAQQYVDKFGLAQLPVKYHYLLDEQDK